MKGILILGASGLVGSYFMDYFKKHGYYVVGTYNSHCKPGLVYFDIENSSIDDVVKLDKFDIAIICSGMVKIDECFKNKEKSESINVSGIEKVLTELEKKSVLPVFISGSVVFNGDGCYKENDERNPINIYGKQKVEVENFIFSKIKEYLILRTGKVFGIKKGEGLFIDWLSMYKNKKQIPCTNDEKLSVTYAEDLARGLELLIRKGKRGIFHINPAESYSRFELATKFFNYLGIKDMSLIQCSIDKFNFLDARAKNSYLDASKFIKEVKFKFTPIERCFDLIKENSK